MKTFQVLITAQNWSNLLSQPLTWKLSQKLYLARIKLFPRCTTFQTSQAARFRTSWRSSLHSCRILTSSARCQTLMGRTMMLSKLPSFISKKTTTHKDSLGFPKLDIFVPTRWVHSRKHCPSLWRVFIAWVSGSQATPFPLAQWSRTDFEDSSWAARSLSSCLCEFMALWDKKLGMRSIAVSRVWPLTGGVKAPNVRNNFAPFVSSLCTCSSTPFVPNSINGCSVQLKRESHWRTRCSLFSHLLHSFSHFQYCFMTSSVVNKSTKN